MSRLFRPFGACVGLAALLGLAGTADAGDRAAVRTRAVGASNGVGYLQVLGTRAGQTLAPASGSIGALVALPFGARAETYGLESVVPGIARLRGSAARIEAFGLAHPELRVEVAPPLHPLMDRVGQLVRSIPLRAAGGPSGTGVLIGVADTGLDVLHPEMRDANGKSRVAWLLDFSYAPLGVHPELEERFGIRNDDGKLAAGAVFSRDMIDELIADVDKGVCVESASRPCAPSDEIGHGTHVAGIAAATGANGKYPGVAPGADIVFVRLTRGRGEGIENDDLVRAVDFMFDRADAEKRPTVVNLSLGSEFGPHDGTFLWEQAIAAHVGPEHPGHVIVASAGNSGSIDAPNHQSVKVTKGTTMRVPVRTEGADAGAVNVWITLRKGADIKIGLDGPDGEWIGPVGEGEQNGARTSEYEAGIVYGGSIPGSPIPATSRGGVVAWTGKWPSGTYNITLEGSGMAELYIQGLGDVALGTGREALFANGVREGTVTLPATHPSIIGVGCTVSRPSWVSIGGAEVSLRMPLLDEAGGVPKPRVAGTAFARDVIDGEVCWFSSAGPTPTGVPKPEIAAPGAVVFSTMSRSAKPGSPGSIFTKDCPPSNGKPDNRCLQIDDTHAGAVGTSMSSPVVAGVAALLLQADPTLTQEKVVALLQAGAHRFRSNVSFFDQAGPGEVDAIGSLDALAQMNNPVLHLPSAAQSWISLSADYVAADGSTPMTVIIELRNADGSHRADFFDSRRLAATLQVNGKNFDTPLELVRRGPGVWLYSWTPPVGLGGSVATFGASFDGVPIVESRTVPIATDRWTASYASHGSGSGCIAAPGRSRLSGSSLAVIIGAALFAAIRRTRRRRSLSS